MFCADWIVRPTLKRSLPPPSNETDLGRSRS